MIGWFEFDGVRSRDFGLYVSGNGTYNAPERDISSVTIPGKSGTLTIDNKRFKNISVSYPAFIREKFKEHSDEVKQWLLSKSGYRRLEDSYHPDLFRKARFVGPVDFEMAALNKAGATALVFDCMPQRFFKHGEIPLPMTNGGVLHNETLFDALPLIRVYGTSGTLYVGNTVCQLNTINEYVDLDSETQNAYKGTANCNMNVYIPEFPVLAPGMTSIHWEGEIKQVRITPRWWTI